MNKLLAGKLKAEFDKEIARRLSNFEISIDDKASKFGRLYRWRQADVLHVFLLLIVSRNDNRFTIEAAWCPDAYYPLDLPVKVPQDSPQFNLRREFPINGRYRFRLAGLFYSSGDCWWKASNQDPCEEWGLAFLNPPLHTITLGSLADNVSNAIDAFEQFGLPYIQENACPQ